MDGYWCDACRGPWEPGQGLFCHCPCAKPAYIDADARFRWKYPRQELTVDDLVRLVVGMQWREACAMFDPLYANAFGESEIPDDGPRRRVAALPTAVDIVDEWLGVR